MISAQILITPTIGISSNIDNVLATRKAWPPPLPPSASYGEPRLDDLGDAHAKSYG